MTVTTRTRRPLPSERAARRGQVVTDDQLDGLARALIPSLNRMAGLWQLWLQTSLSKGL